MNRHFEDTQYYVKRATSEAKRGVVAELEPVKERIAGIAGTEDEPDPSRLDSIKTDLEEMQGRAKGEASDAIGTARERLEALRENRAAN